MPKQDVLRSAQAGLSKLDDLLKMQSEMLEDMRPDLDPAETEKSEISMAEFVSPSTLIKTDFKRT